MVRTPIPPATRVIERLESITTEHACTALAPLDNHEEENRVRVKNLLQALEHTTADFVGDQAAASLRTALEGRVDTLVVFGNEPLWGRFDEATWQMSLDSEQNTGSRDLIDLAMRATWCMGGRIRTVDAASRPAGDLGPLLATLRYQGLFTDPRLPRATPGPGRRQDRRSMTAHATRLPASPDGCER